MKKNQIALKLEGTVDLDEYAKTEKVHSIGVLTGRLETLQHRRNAFTLYDSIFDQGVQCLVPDNLTEQLRQAWGKKVSVTGDIVRDPETGRPLEIREVTDIKVQEEQDDTVWQVKSILSLYASPVPSEIRIQEMRHTTH